jgi:hypothetical protein
VVALGLGFGPFQCIISDVPPFMACLLLSSRPLFSEATGGHTLYCVQPGFASVSEAGEGKGVCSINICYVSPMKRVLILAVLILAAGCSTAGTRGTSDDPLNIYKVDHRLVTRDGKQTYEKEVVKVPYTP